MYLRKAFAAAALAAAMTLPLSAAVAKDLVIGLKAEPSSIDPHYHNLGPNNSLARDVFDRLIMPDETQQFETWSCYILESY